MYKRTNKLCRFTNFAAKNVKKSLKAWFYHQKKKKLFLVLNVEQKAEKNLCPSLPAVNQTLPPALQPLLAEAIKKRQVDADQIFHHSFIIAKKQTIHYKIPTLIFFERSL
ncbi:MAG: hypothetical protein A2W27_04130 [Deltaproteobacteria bacterium RBG_16_44_11]|nr:MAG: hypothetical protein A2W27_04130 [Deltaproteobacteria bacterium RBG_16_44_11]